MRLFLVLPVTAYLCGNIFFAERLGDILWPICVDFLNNYPLETLWS